MRGNEQHKLDPFAFLIWGNLTNASQRKTWIQGKIQKLNRQIINSILSTFDGLATMGLFQEYY